MGATGLEPVTPSVSSKGHRVVSDSPQEVTERFPQVCTPVCTSNEKNNNENGLEALAAALLGLSPEDRAKLAAMLLGKG
jgi:hypothetical protein